MKSLDQLNVKIFADGADLAGIAKLAANPLIKGFTTNPTLMRKAGVVDYRAFSLEVLRMVGERPVSFEVFSDDFLEMEKEAHVIASWGRNVYVKIPVTNSKRQFAGDLIGRLSKAGVQVNVTALMTKLQVEQVLDCLSPDYPSCISVFAGRVADTGRDPMPAMAEAVTMMSSHSKAELIWASPRELLNIFHAEDVGCHIITVTHDILAKFALIGKNLEDYSLETVKMFYNDATAAGFRIETDGGRCLS
jgi:transaldolase